MAIRYKLFADVDGQPATSIQKILDDGTILCVPKDPANTDYYTYLEWAKTNTAEAAD